MSFPSAARYNEAVQNPTLYFSDPEVKRRRAHTDALGLPEALSGGFAFTYRFSGTGEDIAVRCFHREIPELFERYRAISAFLQTLRSRFFVDFTFAEHGVRIDGKDFPVVRMPWIEGQTLLGYVSRCRSERVAIGSLRKQLLELAEEAESQGYAHGDIQHRNIMVTPDGSLRLVDYDGMYVPALKHLKSADTGHPNFQPASRSPSDFGRYVDRFPFAVIDLSLEALMERPELFDKYHRGENLILSRNDFINPSSSPVLDTMARIPHLAPRVAAFVEMCELPARYSLKEFRANYAGRSTTMPTPSTPSQRGEYAPSFEVVDGTNYKTAMQFVGRPVELIGQVLQVKEQHSQGLVLLRFGMKFDKTPAVVVPQEVFSQWPEAKRVDAGTWVSARGTLRALTYKSFGYSTVQLMVREPSDIEILPGKKEAESRLGGRRWQKTEDVGVGDPDWLVEDAEAERRRQEEARLKAEREAAFIEAQRRRAEERAKAEAEHKAKEEAEYKARAEAMAKAARKTAEEERARMNAEAERRRQEEARRKADQEAAFKEAQARMYAEAIRRDEAERRAAETARQEHHKAHPVGKLAEYEMAKPNWLPITVAIVVAVLIVVMIAMR